MKLLLFDIDGTLIHARGAGIRAINRAFSDLYDIEDAMQGIKPDGKTDPLILREMFRNTLNRDYLGGEADRIYRGYLLYLEEEMKKRNPITVLDGISQILKAISLRDDLKLGVATGNIEEGAWIKLRHSGLDSYFEFGAFGCDSEDRGEIIRVAIERGERVFNNCSGFDEVFVIGDTPFDIIHGKEAGATVFGVATGSYSLGDLEIYDPDYLFEDFSDVDMALKVFVG
jgi:phosphoglycolate phosphatase